jgi:hypothetical protein
MKTIKDCVNSIVTPNLTGSITYLDFEQSASKPSELGLTVKQKHMELAPHSSTATLTKEQIDDILRFHSIDAGEMTQSTLANEDEQYVSKRIIEKMWNMGHTSYLNSFTPFQKWANKWFGYVPLQLVKSDVDLVRVINLHANRIAVKSRRGPGNFIVVPFETGSILQDQPNFEHEPLAGGIVAGGVCYKIGHLNGRIEVFVDPFMKYDAKSFIIGKTTQNNDPGLYYVTRDTVEKLETALHDPIGSVKYSHVRWDWLGKIGSNASDHFFTVRYSDKKHNLWKHLISKYIKK